MSDIIIKFISQYIQLTEAEIEIILEQNLMRSYKKDTILLSEGEYAKECFFVVTGCVRRYYVIEGDERTTEFYTEGQPITPVSYVTKRPSEYYLSCMEDCIIALGSSERNKMLVEKVPRLESFVSQMNAEMLIRNENLFDKFKNLSPELRYLNLMETRPDLFRRVPLNHLATYLGITPVSLSRMRKRLTENRNVQIYSKAKTNLLSKDN